MQMKAQCDVYSREALISAIEAHDIISFDIFDTLVMRNVYVNKDVFRLLAREIDPVWGVDFVTARTEAEFTLSRETYPYIEEIYADVVRRCPCLAGQEEALIRRELERILEEMLSALNDRQQQVLRLHFGIEDGNCYSLEEISKMLGISKERVRQLEKHAMEKLQKLGVGFGLEDFLNG